MPVPSILLATVCLERNRWGSRVPSFWVSGWVDRIADAGFEGIELWENHYLQAAEKERETLRQSARLPVIFNTYAGFSDSPDDVAARSRAADAATDLRAIGIKYNLGPDPARLGEYRRNLLSWAGSLPKSCRPLCECHPGTVLEKLEDAVAFFAGPELSRFPVISHVVGDADAIGRCVDAWGDRLTHLHIQLREPDHATAGGRARLAACAGVLRSGGFRGSATIEFTRGMGKNERIETIFDEAIADMRAFREAWE